MREEIIMADEDFLSLNEVGAIAVGIDASAVESSARHVLASPADQAIVKREVVVLTVDLLHMSLHNRNPPAQRQPIMRKHHGHVLIPMKLPLGAFLVELFLVGEGEIDVVAVVKVIMDDSLT